MMKKVPEFNSEHEEDEFWQNNDSTEYVEWESASPVIFSKLKPSTKSVSIRLPVTLIENIKFLANKKDVPYQSFLKTVLEEAVTKEIDKGQ